MNPQVLLDAATIVEAGWCQGSNARRANGQRCSHRDLTATQFCLIGAVYCAAENLRGSDFCPATELEAMRQHLGYEYIDEFNDRPNMTAATVAEELRKCATKTT